MGTMVQIENYLPAYYSLKDLNRESSGASWHSNFGESNLSNGQFHYGLLPRIVVDSHSEYDKDFVKQTMLEHEAIFKIQVYELHRLYKVQRDLMNEVRRKEQYKRRIPYDTSSSSPAPSQMQYLDVQKPIKLRRRMLDLQLPADQYIDPDEVVQFNDVKDSDYSSLSPAKNRKSVTRNGKSFLAQGDDTSVSNLHVTRPKTLADLNEPLLVDEATSVTSVDFLLHGGGSQCDSQYNEFSARLVNTYKDIPQNPKNGNMNGTSNNVHFEHIIKGVHWLGSLESENKGSTRSINQEICPEKAPVASEPVHILLDQGSQPPALLTGDNINGDPWKAKSGSNLENSDRDGFSLSSYNVPGLLASHISNQPEIFHPSYLGKSWDQCASSWGKPSSFLHQKSRSVQTSPFLISVQANHFGNNKWNLNDTPSILGNETPVRNGFYEGSSSGYKGFDHVNINYSEKKVSCSSINYSKATNCIDLNPLKSMNLNVAPPNGSCDDHVGQQGVQIVNKSCKLEDPLAVLPWLRGKTTCNNEVESSRKGPNSLESALSRWGSSVASNSREADVKAKISNSGRKILGVPIFENLPTPKKEVSKHLLIHCCSGNKESENSERKRVLDINVPRDPLEEEVVVLEENAQIESASLIHNFDLNSCVIDEEVSCETTFSVPENKTPIRVGTGIDLEAPVILENEETIVIFLDEDSSIKDHEKQLVLSQHNADDGESELARSAASAIVAMSSFVNVNKSEEAICLEVATDLDDPLNWFVEIACSNNGDDLENENDLLTKGLDDFEMMTLRQRECNEEEYLPKSSFPEVPNAEERGTCMLTTTRTRKGHARRGRQKRDFQRDIFPSLVSLSRLEVTEDLQMFGGLMRATGHAWHTSPNRRNSTRNGCARGRRKSFGTTADAVSPGPSPAPVAALFAVPVKQQSMQSKNTEVGVDDRSLTGWGRTTRRPRRQRCPAGYLAHPPVPLT